MQQLQLCQTLRRGHGLKTTVDIPSGTLIIEYRGEVMTEDSCLDRMAEDKNAVYFLNYDTGEVIDACRKGTEARFINHSCEPNCHIEKWRVNGEFCIGVVASGDIKAGTELTYDYKFESVSDDNMLQCHCGASKCRGLIGENGKVDGDRRRSKKSGSSSAATLSASSPPFKKRVDPERRFWLRKQKKDKLFYAIKEGNMNKARLMIAKLFLFRNLRSAEKVGGIDVDDVLEAMLAYRFQ